MIERVMAGQFFAWTDGVTGETTTWAVDWMLQDWRVRACPVLSIGVESHLVQRLWADLSVDKAKLDQTTPQDVLRRPILLLDDFQMERSEAYFMVDGIHRYVRAHQLGITEVPGRVLPKRLWEQFVVRPGHTIVVEIE